MKNTHPNRIDKLMRMLMLDKATISLSYADATIHLLKLSIPSKFNEINLIYDKEEYSFISGRDLSTSHYSYEAGPSGKIPEEDIPKVEYRFKVELYSQATKLIKERLLQRREEELNDLVAGILERMLKEIVF